MWVMIAISLLSVGCHHGLGSRCYKRLSNPYVCPSCDARSINECCCFPESANAGYCETTWAPLQAAHATSVRYRPQSTPEYSTDIEYSDDIEYSEDVEYSELLEDIEFPEGVDELNPPAARSLDDGSTRLSGNEGAVMQVSAEAYADSDAAESEFVSDAEPEPEPEAEPEPEPEPGPEAESATESKQDQAPPVYHDYQPLSEYFRTARK